MRRDQHREGGSRPGHERHESGRARLGARASHHGPPQQGVGPGDALPAVALGAVGDQDVEAAEVVEDGVREAGTQRCDLAVGA
jgi:hypothetical protein